MIWKIVIAVVITALISGGGVYVWHKSTVKKITNETSQAQGELQQKIDELQTERSKFQLEYIQRSEKMLTSEVEDLKKELERKEELLQSQPRLDDWYVEKFKKRGLKKPVDDIKSDVMRCNELIPYKGTLGGTMKFFHENSIHILSPNWVLAYFEDGHNYGEMLLEYQVLKDGAISWRVIDSYLDTMIDRQYRDK